MSKKKEDNPLSAFGLMDKSVPLPTEDTKLESEVIADELSEEEIEALDKKAEDEQAAREVEDSEEEEEEEVIEDKKPKKTKKKATKEEVEEVEDTSEDDDDSEEDDEDDATVFQEFANHMNDKGIFDMEEGAKITSEEDLEALQVRQIEKGIDAYKEAIPEDGQKFLEFIQDGGNAQDFHKHYYNEVSYEEFDISSDANQEAVIRESLKLEGLSDEEVNDDIADFKDLDKMEKKAGTHLRKLQRAEKQQKKILLDTQKRYADQQDADNKKALEDFKDGLYKSDKIGDFVFTKKMKDDTWKYMMSQDKKTGKTQYQVDQEKDETARYMMAYLMKNKWSLKDLEKTVKSKVTSDFKSKLNRFSDQKNKLKSGSKGKKTKIEDDSLGGFTGLSI